MRGRVDGQISLLCPLNPEELIPDAHPLREIKVLIDEALSELDADLTSMYASLGRASIPPEQILKSMLLMALYSVRSERQFCEQLRYNLLFRWFLDMDMTASVFDRSVFAHNRDRLLEHSIARKLFGEVVENAKRKGLVSRDHFSVDGTLIEAWASMKSFRPKDEEDTDDSGGPTSKGGGRNRWRNFRGKKRKNDTHESTTDPEAKLMRKGKGKEAKLSFSAHAMIENRSGLVVDFEITEANGTAERDVAIAMLDRLPDRGRRITLGADRGYDTKDFVAQCRTRNVTPHVAMKTNSAIDRRTTRHASYVTSQRIRKRVEEPFGWLKSFGGLRKVRFIGISKVNLQGLMATIALNALRIGKLAPST